MGVIVKGSALFAAHFFTCDVTLSAYRIYHVYIVNNLLLMQYGHAKTDFCDTWPWCRPWDEKGAFMRRVNKPSTLRLPYHHGSIICKYTKKQMRRHKEELRQRNARQLKEVKGRKSENVKVKQF